jgi:DNA-binding NarL/FixJ family response regulator
MPAKILIVDDHEVVRQGIRTILKSRADWEVCGEANNGTEAIAAVMALSPDVIILDITMPDMSGLEAALRIAKLGLSCRVLIFTMHESKRLINDVREVGARGYVLKSQAARNLIVAVDTLLAGGTFFGSDVRSEPKEDDESNPGISSLA